MLFPKFFHYFSSRIFSDWILILQVSQRIGGWRQAMNPSIPFLQRVKEGTEKGGNELVRARRCYDPMGQ